MSETEAETNYCETETKKWSREHAGHDTLTYLCFTNLLTQRVQALTRAVQTTVAVLTCV